MNTGKKLVCVLFSVLCASLPFYSQVDAADRLRAAEEFRRGVQAYYRGAFNDAVMVFENALSYVPGEPLILEWLGRSYYRSGIEDAALQQWQFAHDAGFSQVLLRQRMELVRSRRTIRGDFEETSRFVESGEIRGTTVDTVLFRQPVSVVALSDGSFWVSAYGSNELVRFDANGQVVGRSRGPLAGFDRPFDVIRLPDGRLLVTEVSADRVSVLAPSGEWVSSFGSRGRGKGQFVGPQYLAFDSSGNIFVTDYGNSRVVVFDGKGTGLYTFGERNGSFPGFTAPGGIVIHENRVFVADTISGALHEFDTSGNYQGIFLPEGTLVQAEAIRLWNNHLIVSQGNRVVLFSLDTGASFDAARLGNAPIRITSAVPDANGNLILADYRGDSIQIVSRIRDLVGGMSVSIDRVHSLSFPEITLEVRVEDANHNPIVGLTQSNFLVTEEKRPVSRMRLTGAAYRDEACDITVLIDRSAGSDAHLPGIRDALSQIAAAMNGLGTLRIVSAGQQPVLEGSGSPSSGTWNRFVPRTPASRQWSFDLGLRLAVNDLINAAQKRAVIFLTTGDISSASFTRYGLDDLAAFMMNNGVIFSVIELEPATSRNEFRYLTDKTRGQTMYLYRSEGIADIVSQVRTSPNGVYFLSYTSNMPTDFGRAYLPVELEVYLLGRSGRDETGYFAPLE